ncbi:MAG: hypothetical protein AB8G95_17900 [Anaerolineae bacterium]
MSNHETVLRDMGWEDGLLLASCNNCGITLMQPADMMSQSCVHCGAVMLEEIDPEADRPPHLAPPELVLNLKKDRSRAESELAAWVKKFYFPPADLDATKLNQRMRLVYVPAWLMDTTLETIWMADAGYNYDVVSSREKLRGSQWSTEQVTRTKKDWEGRAGNLTLRYDNLPADAIEDELHFWNMVQLRKSGDRFVKTAAPFTQREAEPAAFLLPSRIPADAVNDMLPVLMERAKADVQVACRADQVRNFNWAPKIQEQNWTQMLIPVWSTWYLDEDDRTRMVFLNGVTGHGWGEKIPSMKRTWRVGLYFLIAALALISVGALAGLASGSWAAFGGLTVLAMLLMGMFMIAVLFVMYQKNKEDYFSRF